MWPDVEAELIARLSAALSVRHVTDLPANLLDALPINQVQRIGGEDDGIRLDRALVTVDSYANDRAGASLLARRTRQELVERLRGVQTTRAVFGRVATISAPAWRPYENTALRRMGATYEIYFHPVS
ncbi:hypothetical protein GCM10010293_41000 [Streptomyces griseoflavus]|uniref:hypothetical protein n=1 Tax=Streptomyces griseoflavus TaxID=35619 RepID=UPI00167DD3FE|nr:hypothetical protein [Streptomyces griseoflavus]GGV37258.1 hypothetical protein GCM10010293_41000 [Streptomyces griseoflavus]